MECFKKKMPNDVQYTPYNTRKRDWLYCKVFMEIGHDVQNNDWLIINRSRTQSCSSIIVSHTGRTRLGDPSSDFCHVLSRSQQDLDTCGLFCEATRRAMCRTTSPCLIRLNAPMASA